MNTFSVKTPNGIVTYKMPPPSLPANPLPDVRDKKEYLPEMLQLNPPYDYNKSRPAPRAPPPQVTVRPMEQLSIAEKMNLLNIDDTHIRWDLHYNRFHDKKRKPYYKLKTGNEPPLKKKKEELKSWEFDTSKWTFK